MELKKALIQASDQGFHASQNKQELHKLFFKLRDEMGQTFVIVTHDEVLAKDADRVVHMNDGMIIAPDSLVG